MTTYPVYQNSEKDYQDLISVFPRTLETRYSVKYKENQLCTVICLFLLWGIEGAF